MIRIDRARLTIGGHDPNVLAKRWGTPLFVYDADEVRASWDRIRDAFRYAPTHLHFAAVCNPNLALLALLRGLGAKLHANTLGDVYRGLRAGYDPHDIVFSGGDLGEDDLAYLLGVHVHVNVDSLDDLRRACALGRGRALGLRMHLDGVLPESRIGLREDQLADALAIGRSAGCRITGMKVHCGTHGQSLQRYREALDRVVGLALRAPDIECINLGGGFADDYSEPEERGLPFVALARAAEAGLLALSQRLGRTMTLRVEPGRALVAPSAALLTRVRSVERTPSRRYVGVDTTTASVTSPVVRGARRRVVCADERPAADGLADVCGCTTCSRDFVARGMPLPDVAAGDLLAILDVGAYGYSMSSHFLNRPRPAEVMVDGGKVRVITPSETFDDLVSMQCVI